MNILHLTYDGYHPNNDFSLINPEKVVDCSKYTESHFLDSEDLDVGVDYLESADMWIRMYSGWEVRDAIKEFGDKSTLRSGLYNRVKKVPRDTWIWNKLAKQGVTSIMYPFYSIARAEDKENNFLLEDDIDKDLVNMIVRPYYSKYYNQIEDGVGEYKYSDYGYSSLIREIVNMNSSNKNDSEIIKEFETRWDNFIEGSEDSTTDGIDKHLPRLISYLENNLDSARVAIDNNYKILSEEFYPFLLSKFNKDNDNYTHVGLAETDIIWHFSESYTEFNEYARDNLFHKLLSDLIGIVNPDIILVNGDHGMVNSFDTAGRSSKKCKFYHNGTEFKVKRPRSGVLPCYNEHSNKVGGYVWAKPEFKSKIDLLYDINNKLTYNRSYRYNKYGLVLDSIYNWLQIVYNK